MIEGASCGDCRFWERADDIGFGHCRRNPPVVSEVEMLSRAFWKTNDDSEWIPRHDDDLSSIPTPDDFESRPTGEWPEVYEDAWCGEFQPQPKPEVSQT